MTHINLNMASLKAYEIKIPIVQFLSLQILLTFFQATSQESTTGFSLQLIPWDSPKSPLYQPNLTQTQKVNMMAISSTARAQTLNSSLIIMPTSQRSLRYAVKIRIGKLLKEVTLLLDTGSGPIWTHCSGSEGSDFNPSTSKSYKTLSCQHPLCSGEIGRKMCRCINNQCVCTIRYGISDNKLMSVNAVLSSDSFTLPLKYTKQTTFKNMIFGCVQKSPQHPYSGVLGLDKMAISLIGQVKKSVKGRYSYCLHSGGGYLTFGDDIPKVGKDVKTTSILYPRLPTLYLKLIDISVGDKRLHISPDLFSLQQGGFLVDTGNQFSVLKKEAYDKVMQEFVQQFSRRGLRRKTEKTTLLEVCYENIPNTRASMTYHLEGADYETSDLFVLVDPDTMCIGLMPGKLSILGANQQWNKRIIFDLQSNVFKFVDYNCANDRYM